MCSIHRKSKNHHKIYVAHTYTHYTTLHIALTIIKSISQRFKSHSLHPRHPLNRQRPVCTLPIKVLVSLLNLVQLVQVQRQRFPQNFSQTRIFRAAKLRYSRYWNRLKQVQLHWLHDNNFLCPLTTCLHCTNLFEFFATEILETGWHG